MPHMQAFIQLVPLISPPFLPVEILVIGDASAVIRRGGGRRGAAMSSGSANRVRIHVSVFVTSQEKKIH